MATFSVEPHRTAAYSCDLRWRVIYQRLGMGLACVTVARNLGIDPATVSRTVALFESTGDVEPVPRTGAPSKLCDYDQFVIIENLLDQPSMYLYELQQVIEESTGTQVAESTICRFLKKNDFFKKKATPCSFAT